MSGAAGQGSPPGHGSLGPLSPGRQLGPPRCAGQSVQRQPLTSGAEQRSQQHQQELRRRGQETAPAAPPHGGSAPAPRPGRPQRGRGLLLRGAPRHDRRSLPPQPRQLRGRGLPPRSARPGPAPKEEPRRGSPRPAPPSAEALRKLSARQRRFRGQGSAAGQAPPFATPFGRRPSPRRDPWARPQPPDPLSPCPGCGSPPCPRTGKPFLKRLRCSAPSVSALPVPSPAASPKNIAPGSRLPAAGLLGILRSPRVAITSRLVPAVPRTNRRALLPVPVCQTPFERETLTSPLPSMHVATYEKRLIFPSVHDNILLFGVFLIAAVSEDS